MARSRALVVRRLLWVSIAAIVSVYGVDLLVSQHGHPRSPEVAIFLDPMAQQRDVQAIAGELKATPGVVSFDLGSVPATGTFGELSTGGPSLLPCYIPGCTASPTLAVHVFHVEITNPRVLSAVTDRFSGQPGVLLVRTSSQNLRP